MGRRWKWRLAPHAHPPRAIQVGEGFNRDYWARFERFVQDTTKSFDDVWVVTGPLYIPRPTPTGWQMDHGMLGGLDEQWWMPACISGRGDA